MAVFPGWPSTYRMFLAVNPLVADCTLISWGSIATNPMLSITIRLSLIIKPLKQRRGTWVFRTLNAHR